MYRVLVTSFSHLKMLYFGQQDSKLCKTINVLNQNNFSFVPCWCAT